MLRRKIYTKIKRKAHRFYSIILLSMILIFNGCTAHKGDLTFNTPSPGECFNISGKIYLPEIIETDSARATLTTLSDFSNFKITAGEITSQADKAGNYSLKSVPFSDSLVIKAVSNKIALLRRVTADELCYSDLSSLQIDINTTAEALVYEQGLLLKKDLTPADIRAREYQDGIATLTTAIKLAMQLPKNSINKTTLDLVAVTSAAKQVALNCVARDSVLKDANTVLRHAFLRKDLDLVKMYISPSFSNDWDSNSNWSDVVSYFEILFAKHDYVSLTWEILETEFLENNRARIRTKVNAVVKETKTDEIVINKGYTFDAFWQLEGTIWKLYKNMPYRDTHPTQVDADVRWGEIAAAYSELQAAVNGEIIASVSYRVSEAFRNAFDGTSTKNELMLVTTRRFNTMDVKISEYAIENIKFNGNESAEVTCSGRIKFINLLLGKDVDSGLVRGKVIWIKEDGVWKIYRDLPYKFSHPLTID